MKTNRDPITVRFGMLLFYKAFINYQIGYGDLSFKIRPTLGRPVYRNCFYQLF